MRQTKKTKIIATVGPATSSKKILTSIIKQGVNVIRINFSHGAYEEHQLVINRVREINKEKGQHTAILADLQGPKIRIGKVEDGGFTVKKGQEVTFTTKKTDDPTLLYISYPNFPKDVKKGEEILIDDGKLSLEVISTDRKHSVVAKFMNPGIVTSNKGVNLPDTKISLPCLTAKDKKDLEFVLENDVEWIGLSFVRRASDIIELKDLIQKGNRQSRVIAKIEKPEAIENIAEIIEVTDALMVARGDLGVEIPMEKVPLLQKELVKMCLKAAKPVIIATQMMESMIASISPTRAEVNDVANAVLDGADAVMLSAETSVGKYPVKVIQAMSKIIGQIEQTEQIYHNEFPPELNEERFISDSICYNACRLSQRVDGKAIVSMTHSGYTAQKLSSFRPKAGIYAFTGNHSLLNKLSLVWGVQGFYYDKYVSTDHTIADIKYLMKKNGILKEKDLIINIASMPINEKGQSNMIKLSYVE